LAKVLVLTGRLCSQSLGEIIDHDRAEILELPIEVAALMSPDLIFDYLRQVDLTKYDYMLLPGVLDIDLEELSGKLGIPIFLGPTHYHDVPTVLENLEESKLSTTAPADLVLKKDLRNRTVEFYRKSLEDTGLGENCIMLGRGEGSVVIGGNLPPRVIGEIVNAPSKDIYEILLEAKALVGAGASIIDIGMIPGSDNPEFIEMILPLIRRDLGVPVSVDTMREVEINAASDAGADFILSICGSTLDLVPSIDTPVVVVPLDSPDKERPVDTNAKLGMLIRFAEQLRDYDVIVDPLLEPIGRGFSESIRAYLNLQERLPNSPALMGVGNVTELADVDSIGMNAILAAIAVETNTSLLLTTENSPKTRGSVRELQRACQMMFFSRVKAVPPKNIGIDLLKIKEKTSHEYPVRIPREKVLATPHPRTSGLDEGQFHITIKNSIINTIYRDAEREVDILGKSAEVIAEELEEQGLLPGSMHAFYLGCELTKAELALQLARSYLQDAPLFGEDGEDGESPD
jgi:dihydropteroate synthase-like protein